MACEPIGDICPRPGDTDNILLRKILLALTSGSGVAGGQGIVETTGGVVNFAQSGPYTPGAVPFATGPTTMGFDPANFRWEDTLNQLQIGGSVQINIPNLAGLILNNSVGTLNALVEFRDLGIRQGGISWDSGILEWFSDFDLVIGPAGGAGILFFQTNAIDRWQVSTAGHFLAVTDNTLDIGASGATRPRTIYAGTSVATPVVQFPAVQIPSADPNALDDYEEGTWTPVDGSGAGLVFTSVFGDYVKIGRQVTLFFRLIYPVTANGAGAIIAGIPFTPESQGGHQGGYVTYTTSGLTITMLSGDGIANFTLYKTTGAGVINSEMSAHNLRGVIIYTTA